MRILADARTIPLQSGTVQCVVTSPPYWGLRDYGTARWEGGDVGCDHLRPVRRHKDGCLGCGCPMQDETPGCRWCADRHVKRRIHNTPEGRSYEQPSEFHWEKPRSRDQVTDAGVPYADLCRKCGAQRIDAQIGLEPTPDAYVAALVGVFREVWRVLRDDGTLWLNLGDSYVSTPRGNKNGWEGSGLNGIESEHYQAKLNGGTAKSMDKTKIAGLKPKDLVGIPWRVAFALQSDGWYLRSDIIWAKPNPMPESVTDRPTKAHEYVFLLTKRERYYYDAEAIREVASMDSGFAKQRLAGTANWSKATQESTGRGSFGEVTGNEGANALWTDNGYRNARSVWTINPKPYAEAHFATMPEKLAERCIKAGSKPGDLVLDPFGGSGTTVRVAKRFNRRGVMLDLNPAYLDLAEARTSELQPSLLHLSDEASA